MHFFSAPPPLVQIEKDEVRTVCPCSYLYHCKVISRELFTELEREVEYLSGELAKVKVFGKVYDIPRKQAGKEANSLNMYIVHRYSVKYIVYSLFNMKIRRNNLKHRKKTIRTKNFFLTQMILAYGDPGIKYKYSGTSITAKSWSPTLLQLRDLVKEATGHTYNFVLVNRLINKLTDKKHLRIVLILKY